MFLKTSAIVRNNILFCLLSVFFLSVATSLSSGVSALDIEQLKAFAIQNQLYVGTVLLSIFFIGNGTKLSPVVFLSLAGITLFKSFELFAADFNKIILGLSFLYSVVAYNLFLFLRLELTEPFYNPGYEKNILPTYESKLLPVVIKSSGISRGGYLTNWGRGGFYCKLESTADIRGKVEVEIRFENNTFLAEGVVTSTKNNGVGVRVKKKDSDRLGWADFYGIISELGLSPGRGG